MKVAYKMPDGHVDIQSVEVAHQLDKCATTLQAMPKITDVPLNQHFERMRVNYAFHLYSTKVARKLFCKKRKFPNPAHTNHQQNS